jgi:transposase
MVGLDSRGAIVLREKVSRGRITSRPANVPSCLIGIEAGLATHYVARELAALGHDVKQVPPTPFQLQLARECDATKRIAKVRYLDARA